MELLAPKESKVLFEVLRKPPESAFFDACRPSRVLVPRAVDSVFPRTIDAGKSKEFKAFITCELASVSSGSTQPRDALYFRPHQSHSRAAPPPPPRERRSAEPAGPP